MNVTERRDRLIKLLMMNGPMTTKKLSEELEVSIRTVLRDIDIMSTSKPIYTTNGRNGGVYLMNTYDANRVYFSKEEALLMNKIIDVVEHLKDYEFNDSECKMLKEIVAFYTQPIYKKGIRYEQK